MDKSFVDDNIVCSKDCSFLQLLCEYFLCTGVTNLAQQNLVSGAVCCTCLIVMVCAVGELDVARK